MNIFKKIKTWYKNEGAEEFKIVMSASAKLLWKNYKSKLFATVLGIADGSIPLNGEDREKVFRDTLKKMFDEDGNAKIDLKDIPDSQINLLKEIAVNYYKNLGLSEEERIKALKELIEKNNL